MSTGHFSKFESATDVVMGRAAVDGIEVDWFDVDFIDIEDISIEALAAHLSESKLVA